VIEVCAHDEVFVLEDRVAAFENSDHVLAVALFDADSQMQGELFTLVKRK
jgi:hypothetical protein